MYSGGTKVWTPRGLKSPSAVYSSAAPPPPPPMLHLHSSVRLRTGCFGKMTTHQNARAQQLAKLAKKNNEIISICLFCL